MHAGPTMRKVIQSDDMIGTRLFDRFEVTRPHGVARASQSFQLLGQTVHLTLRAQPNIRLKGVGVRHPTIDDAMILNLSFGISVIDAVQTFGLNRADFSPTDLAVEMLYLVEAKSAVMAASRRLNERLLDARTQAEEQAVTDALTGVENRRGLARFVDRLIARQARFALLHVDLDHFKAVNDTLGHDVGDIVLQNAAQIMRDELRDRDHVARVGGDEFILVIEGNSDRDMICGIGARVIARISDLVVAADQALSVGCSMGAVLSDQIEMRSLQDLLKAADLALYASKKAGRGRLTFFDPDEHGVMPDQQSLDGAEPIAKPAG